MQLPTRSWPNFGRPLDLHFRRLLSALLIIFWLAAPARAAEEYFSATLNGASVVPPSGSSAVGLGFLVLDTSTNTLSYNIQFSGLGSAEVSAHIHGFTGPGSNAAILFTLPLGSPKSGTLVLSAGQVTNVRNGLAYVDIHTSSLAGGELRGQISPAMYAHGLQSTALGQALLSLAPSGDLTVSNCGTSGNDGLAISLGSGEGMHLTMDVPPAGSIPNGAVLTNRCVAEIPGQADLVLLELKTERTAGGFVFVPDLAASGASTFTLELFNNGVLVYLEAGATGQAGSVSSIGLAPEICSHEVQGLPRVSQRIAATSWSLPNGTNVTADAIRVSADAIVSLPPTSTLRAEVHSTIPASFTDTQAWIIALGQVHRSLGDARLLASPGQLDVSNVGSTGLDGVQLDFDVLASIFGMPATRGVNIELVPRTLQSGESLILSATGVFSGAPGTMLGEAAVANVAGTVQCSVDFSSIGGTLVQIDVYNAGAFQGTTTVAGGAGIATLSAGGPIPIHGCGKRAPGGGPPCFIVITNGPVTVTPTSGPAMFGDEIRLLAANASGTIDHLSVFDIRCDSNTGDGFAIVSETPILETPGLPFCTGDGTLTDHTTPCPCGNNGSLGNGCGHSFDPNGANMSATGAVFADNIVLHSQFEPASSFTLFLQHANAGDAVFHDGVLCAGNPLIRLRGRSAVGGEAFFPNSLFANDSTTTLSARGGTFPGSGATMRYAAWYRNASTTFCPPAIANVTNGWMITW